VERAASSSFRLALIMLPVLLSAFDIGTGILRVGLNGRNRSLVGVLKALVRCFVYYSTTSTYASYQT
jgi:hypothetical protein